MKTWTTKNGYKIIKLLAGRSNVFLISKDGKFILVDTCTKGSRKKLQRRLDYLGVSNGNLMALVQTHSHYDHAANAAYIKEKYHAKVIVHKNEVVLIEKGDMPLPRGSIFATKWLMNTFGERFKPFFLFEPVKCDISVEDKLDLKDFGFDAYLIHTPGHTEGSMSVIVDNEIAVVGDAMFGVFWGSVFPPFINNVKDMVKSWGRLLETGCKLYLPSHGTEDSRDLLKSEYEKYSKLYLDTKV